jgi:hypothetical protein
MRATILSGKSRPPVQACSSGKSDPSAYSIYFFYNSLQWIPCDKPPARAISHCQYRTHMPASLPSPSFRVTGLFEALLDEQLCPLVHLVLVDLIALGHGKYPPGIGPLRSFSIFDSIYPNLLDKAFFPDLAVLLQDVCHEGVLEIAVICVVLHCAYR